MSNFSIWNKRSILNSALDSWQEKGLIDASVGDVLRADVQSAVKTKSFNSILILLGVVCFAFGAMTFVAANWDVMSSLLRVGVLFAALWGSWIISMFFKYRGYKWLAEVFVLLACTMFGASIMLVAQIYHIQGEPKDATWLWAVGTIIAAFLTRSVPALSLGTVLITVWALMGLNILGSGSSELEYSFIAYWFVCALGARWMASRFIGHILVLSLMLWLGFAMVAFRDFDMDLMTYSVSGAFIILALSLISLDYQSRISGFSMPVICYAIIYLGIALFVMNAAPDSYLSAGRSRLYFNVWVLGISGLLAIFCAIFAYQKGLKYKYDTAIVAAFACIGFIIFFIYALPLPFISEAYLLALSVWVIRMGWRLESRRINILGFVAFSGLMLQIYFLHVGSLINTSLFYLGVGAMLVIGAVLIPRIMRAKSNEEGAA